ncbi:MAG: DUF6089 family protein [Chitinophagales bacterium]
MKKPGHLCLVLCALLAAMAVRAQFHEVGLWGGVANYYGDLNQQFGVKYVRPAGGVFYRYNISSRFAAKGCVSYGEVEGHDAASSSARQQLRNLSFRSSIADLTATFEFNFFKFDKSKPKKYWFSPYLATGVGIFFFNPKAEYKGKWYYLQPLGTEGQNDPSYSGVKKYNLYSFHIPIEGGFKFHIYQNWNINLIVSVHKTFTDYLDDVSGNYPTTVSLPGGSHGIAAALSDRSGEVNGGENAGRAGYQRGETSKKDDFVFVGVSVSYTFMSMQCPTPSNGWTFR